METAIPEPDLASVLVETLAAMSPEQRDRTLADDPAKAVLWVQASARYGMPAGQVAFGRMLLQGHGVAKDPVSALAWFRKAAETGSADAQNMVGRCLENGWGADVDLAAAAQWYDRAARAGLDWAQYNLGHCYLDGAGVTRDLARAFGLYRRAAEQGHVRAMNLVSRCYEQGWGVGPDAKAARDWAQCSAEGGYFRGQYNFGLMLADEGRVDEAVVWLERSVEVAPEPSRTVMTRALAARGIQIPSLRLEAVVRSTPERANGLETQAPSVSFADSSSKGGAIGEDDGFSPCS